MAAADLIEHDAEMAEHEMAGRIIEDLNEESGEAPYGYTRDGKVRGKPGPKPASGGGRPKRFKASPRRGTRPQSKPSSPDYAAGVRGLIQMVAGPLALAGLKRPELMLDAATLAVHAEAIGDGVAAGAHELPQLQAVLDRLMTVGPWGMVIAPVLAVAAQVLTNHGILPAGTLGSMEPGDLLDKFQTMNAPA